MSWPLVSSAAEERFWSRVDRRGPDECWEWTARRDAGGYGRFSFDGRDRLAHAYSLRLAGRSLPAGMETLHTCDNPPCVNPAHLAIGTHKDNIDDMTRKRRVAHGERHPHHRLTWADVAEIRSLYPTLNLQQLADRYGVCFSQIGKIVRGERWVA